MNRHMKVWLRRAAAIMMATGSAWGVAQAATLTRTTAFEYDAFGQITKEIIEPDNSALCVVSTYTYDSRGNRTGSTVRNCNGASGEAPAPTGDPVFETRSGSATYDASGRFPVSATNALNQTITTQYDARFGAPTSQTDPNGITTQTQYDGFGRKTLVIASDGTRTAYAYTLCNGTCPGNGQANGVYSITVTPQNSAGVKNGPQSTAYYDSLGREILSTTEGFDGQLIYVQTQHDALGRVWRTSRPYFAGATIQWKSTYEYDILNRITKETEADGAWVTHAYNGLSQSVTNIKGQTTTRVRNSQGQIVQMIDAANSILTHEFDPFGNLTKTIDPSGNQITVQYNLRGHKIAMSDPDMGNWIYVSNALGELIKQRDAKNQWTTLQYDKLGRLKQRNEADLVSHWYYDKYEDNSPCAWGIGQLCESKSDNGYRNRQYYDSRGRIDHAITTIGTQSFHVYTAWDNLNGRIAAQTYPSGLIVNRQYNARGYLQTLTNADHTTTWWTAQARDAEGHLTLQQYGNGIVTQQTYSATTGRLTAILAGAGNSVQHLTYQHESGTGNLLTRTDANQSLIETLTYDNLNRITTSLVNASAVSPAGYTAFAYDRLGNITCKSDLGICSSGTPNMLYGPQVTDAFGATRTLPHAVKNVIGQVHGQTNPAYQYDANGNFLSGAGRSTTWTSFNMAKVMTRAGVYSTEFFYGPDHQRVKQVSSGSGVTRTTYYLHPDQANGLLYEHDTQGSTVTQRHYLTAAGEVVAEVKLENITTKTQYLHRDHLGSITAITNETGTVIERMAYDAWGKRRYPNGTTDPADSIHANPAIVYNTDRGYTNHEMLDELGLIHMNGRIYDPALARFLSPDPNVPNAEWLQSYNRYTYVRNNPFAFTDPTGYFEDDDSMCSGCGTTFGGGDIGPEDGFAGPLLGPPEPPSWLDGAWSYWSAGDGKLTTTDGFGVRSEDYTGVGGSSYKTEWQLEQLGIAANALMGNDLDRAYDAINAMTFGKGDMVWGQMQEIAQGHLQEISLFNHLDAPKGGLYGGHWNGFRLPDYIVGSVPVYPGIGISFTLDRAGNVYVGPSVGFNLPGTSGRALGMGWTGHASRPDSQQLQGWLSGWAANAGVIIGATWSSPFSPGNERPENLGFNIQTPGVSLGYSWNVGNVLDNRISW